MSSEAGPLVERAVKADFSRRANLSELPEVMDEPCPYEELRACLRDLDRVNRITLGYRPTLQWLEQFVRGAGGPLHIVDVGCGGGEMLRRIERWAGRKRIAVRLTGIDLNPDAIRAAREFTPATSRIRWIAGEAFSFNAAADPVDVVISSLFAHHLTNEEIVRFLQWMERVSRRCWFVNDLCRSRASCSAYQLLMLVAPWHRFLWHDGPVSFRRALVPSEWRERVQAAGLPLDQVSIYTRRPGRLCVGREKAQ